MRQAISGQKSFLHTSPIRFVCVCVCVCVRVCVCVIPPLVKCGLNANYRFQLDVDGCLCVKGSVSE